MDYEVDSGTESLPVTQDSSLRDKYLDAPNVEFKVPSSPHVTANVKRNISGTNVKHLLDLNCDYLKKHVPMIRTEQELKNEDVEALTNPSLNRRMMSLLFQRSQLEEFDIPELSSSAKITLQALRYILERDFPLPKLQMLILDKLHRPLTTQELSQLKVSFPDLKAYGRFNAFEDSVLLKRLSRLMRNLGLSSKQGWKLMSACFGPTRPRSKFALLYGRARFVLSAYIGRPLLSYCRITTISSRLTKLTLASDEDDKPKSKKKTTEKSQDESACKSASEQEKRTTKTSGKRRHDLSGGSSRSTEVGSPGVTSDHEDVGHQDAGKKKKKKKKKPKSSSPRASLVVVSSGGVKRAKKQPLEDAALIRLVLKQQIRDESSAFNGSGIDWASIAAELGRTEARCEAEWHTRIWTPLTAIVMSPKEDAMDEMEARLIEYLLARSYSNLNEVDWAEAAALFPGKSKSFLMRLVRSRVGPDPEDFVKGLSSRLDNLVEHAEEPEKRKRTLARIFERVRKELIRERQHEQRGSD